MRIPPDSFQTQGLRKKLVQELKEKGIDSEKVLAAILQIPRHFFYFDDIFVEKA
jgi:protein-L-isoaspartate(D-aspartate) O-methyltransferase